MNTAIERVPTVAMSREQWLAERRKALGGSDVGAILGLNPYRGPVAVWADKLGKTDDQPDNEAMRQGRDLEAYVAERFAEASGFQVQRYNYLLRDNANHVSGNIDRRVVGMKAGLECKTASALSESRFKGGAFPSSYYAQCCTYMAITGWERWYLAVIVLGRSLTIYQMTTIDGDACPDWCENSVYVSAEELQAIRDVARNWWETYVATETMPPPDGTASTADTLTTIYRGGGGEVKLLREGDLDTYFALRAQIDSLQAQADAIKQACMADMGDAEKATCGQYSISWKPQQRRTLDTKRLQKDNPSLNLEDYYKVTTTRPFKVTDMKED